MRITKTSISNKVFRLMALVSLLIGLIDLLLILNFVFRLTPFQYLMDLPVIVGLLLSPILFIMAFISLRKAGLVIAKIAIWNSIVIFSVLPILFGVGVILGILDI